MDPAGSIILEALHEPSHQSRRSGSTYEAQKSKISTSGSRTPSCCVEGPSSFLEEVSEAVERIDHVECRVDRQELLAHAFDVTVDGALVDKNVFVIGGIHKRIAALDDAGTARKRLQDQKLGHGEHDRLAHPHSGM